MHCQKKNTGPSEAHIKKNTNRITKVEFKGKRIMTSVTTSIAFAIVAIAAIVSNASVFNSHLD